MVRAVDQALQYLTEWVTTYGYMLPRNACGDVIE